MKRRLSVSVALAVAGLLLVAPLSRADTIAIDFETGPPVGTPINDDYLQSSFTRFIAADPGWRPYRRVAAGQAHSGTHVADISPAGVCQLEESQASNCEVPTSYMVARFVRTASSVKLYAGLFQAANGPVSARLTAFTAGGQQINSVSVPIGVGFTTPVEVTSATANIARIDLTVEGPGNNEIGAALGFDDLTMEFPAGTVADVALSGPIDTTVVHQGASQDLPFNLTRINGSNGPVALSASNLPAGVTAEFLPNPVPGTQNTAIMRLTATDDAPTFFEPVDVTITAAAEPPDAQVLGEPRTLEVPISVRSAFELTRPSTAPAALPNCAPADVELWLRRSFNFTGTGTVNLSADGMPTGVSAEFVPSATVPPGGGLVEVLTLRITRGATPVPQGSVVRVRASSPGYPERTMFIPLTNATPTANLDSTTLSGATPAQMQPGSLVRVNGNGFCPGTKVRVGNALAEAPATLEPSLTSLTFRVPRLATSGTVTIVPPTPGTPHQVAEQFRARSFRNHSGFQFNNPGWGNLSLSELATLVGAKEMFISENPCWPFYDCTIITPIPNPIAFAKWQIIEEIVQQSGGHCFGINRAMQEFRAGRVKLRDFASGVNKTFDLPSRSGPNGTLGSYLDHRHAGQTTKEFLLTYGTRNDSISAQITRLRGELAAGRVPGVMVKKSFTKGHVMTASDVETPPDGRVIVHLYDNETEFIPGEDSDTTGATHSAREDASRIIINRERTRWEYTGGGWSGGNDGSFYVTKLSDWPADPTLPGLIDAAIGVFGSKDGAAVTGGEPKGAEIMPVMDRSAKAGAAGFILPGKGQSSFSHEMVGKKEGSYSQMVMGGGFIGWVKGVRTAKGVTDRLAGNAKQRSISFAGGQARPLNLQVGTQKQGDLKLATIHTRSSKGGADSAAIGKGGSLVYEHDGAPTRFSIELEGASKNSRAARFSSGPLRIGDGEKVTLKPESWRSLTRAKLTLRKPGGKARTRRIRSRGKDVPTKIAIKRVGVAGKGKRPKAKVVAKLSKVPARSAAGVVVRVVRGGKVVATRGKGFKKVKSGKRSFAIRLPKLGDGRYRLIANVTVSSAGAQTGTARAKKGAKVRIG